MFQTAVERIRSLEDAVEAERAAHLESKFNSEIVQLRVRDLEGTLQSEKTAKAEIMTTVDRLNEEIR